MKILLLCRKANNHRALANRLHDAVRLSGIALCDPVPKSSRRFERLVAAASMRTIGRPLGKAWAAMQADCARAYPELPLAPALNVNDINAPDVIRWLEVEAPDLVLVSGTNLLTSNTIAAAQKTAPILNLHTGISPYARGGPNCTNWCLANGQPRMIGNTILWLDAGIDSGKLAATERTPLDGSETLGELHIKVMYHAHDLYVRAVEKFVSGGELSHVDQRDISAGRTYYTKDWTASRMLQAVWYHRTGYAQDIHQPLREPITIDL